MNLFTNDAWDDTYVVPDAAEPFTVQAREGLYQTLLPADTVIEFAELAGMKLDAIAAHDFRMENTGPRSVLRAHFLKAE